MTAKHVTVEGLAALCSDCHGDGWYADTETRMDMDGTLYPEQVQVQCPHEPVQVAIAALPDDCPAEAVREWANDQIDVQHELERRHNEQVDRANAAEADAAALAEALRDAVDVAHETDSLRSHSDDERKNGWFRAPLYRCTDAVCAEANAALADHDRRVKGEE